MNSHASDPTGDLVAERAARAITGGLLLVAASILLAALMIAERSNIVLSVIALLNAAMFYLLGLGCLRSARPQRAIAAAEGDRSVSSGAKSA
jgi:threonine/homoserine/homoserine lactone efflux protein